MRHSRKQIRLSDVQAVYSGPEGELWELIMGEQIHLGGMESSVQLAEQAGVGPGESGVDLCCCTGAGMRFLLHFRNVRRMVGVDATEKVVQLGRERCRQEGLEERAQFVLADARETGLDSGAYDFVWGEDAWCYVVDKDQLIREAVRLVKPGGLVAFTDWIEGPEGLGPEEAERFMSFMKFPSVQDIQGYRDLLSRHGCQVLASEHTGRFAPCMELYLGMLRGQHTFDVLKRIGFDMDALGGLGREMEFMAELAAAGKIDQGLFVARKP